MSNLHLDSARAIVRALDPAEASLEAALLANHELAASAIRARQDLNLSISIGHDVLQSLGRGNEAIMAGIDHTIRAHRLLARKASRFGLDPAMVGGATSKDPDAESFWGTPTGETTPGVMASVA